jgi:hypothetical protein
VQTQSPKGLRTIGTGSRGVANLTRAQLVKKRASDREAQRLNRQRTKNRIASLEERIRELESQQPVQELQVVLREKELAQAEICAFREQCLRFLSVIQPLVGTKAVSPPGTLLAKNDSLSFASHLNTNLVRRRFGL